MELQTEHRRQLQDALLDAFSSEVDLEMMVKLTLGRALDSIALGKNLGEIVFRLIDWAERTGHTGNLIQGALKINPGNPRLQALEASLTNYQEPAHRTEILADAGISESAPNHKTIGRSGLLTRISKFLTGSARSQRAFLTLHGPPGIGKTAVVAEYFNSLDHESGFRKYWIDIRNSYTAGGDLAERLVSVLEPEAPCTSPFGRLIALLAEEKILLVLDGIDGQESPALRQILILLRPQMKSRVILTCRRELGLQGELALAVPMLRPVDVRKLILAIVGRASADCSAAELAAIDKVSRTIEGRPALLRQIAQNAKQAPLENLPRIVEELGFGRGSTDDQEALPLAIARNFGQLSTPAQDLFVRVSLLGGVVSSTDVTYMAEVTPQIQGEHRYRLEIAQSDLWAYEQDRHSYRIPSYILEYVRSQSAISAVNMMDLQRIAGERLLMSGRRTGTNWLEGMKLLHSAQSWKLLLLYAIEKFAVTENRAVFSDQDTDLLEPRACWALAFIYYRFGDSYQAIALACQGLDALTPNNPLKEYTLRLRLLTVLAYELFHAQSIARAEQTLLEAEALIQSLSQEYAEYLQSEIPRIWLLRGLYETQRMKGDLPRALELTENAISAFETLQDTVYYLKALSNRATILYKLTKSQDSLEQSKQVLSYYDNSEMTDSFLLATEFCNVVDSYIGLHDWESALEYAERGARYCLDHGEIGPFILLELNAVSGDYATQQIDRLHARLKQVEELHHIVAKQRVYEAMYKAGWAKYEFLRAKMARTARRRAKSLEWARLYVVQIEEMPDAEEDEQVQGILTELKEIAQEFE